MYIQNKYHDLYFKIIENSKNRILSSSIKKEIHHILPKSLGGTNDNENLAVLTLKEHWICHRLLVKFLKDKNHIRKMYNALYMMAVKDYRTVNARIYEQIKNNVEPWNKNIKGYKGTPCSEKTKEYFSNLYKNKQRPESDKMAMREGWKKLKESGYEPWNKGKTGVQIKEGLACVFISPENKSFKYYTFKEGCEQHNLCRSAMSRIKNTEKTHKGWKAMTIPEEN